MRLYFTSQASLLFCLMLSFTFALLAKRIFFVFSVLALNNLFHLLLDALQIKWGNGVHLLAPFSWAPAHFGLLWPEHALMYLLTLAGLFYLLNNIKTIAQEGIVIDKSFSRIVACLSLALYFLLPLVFMSHIQKANSNYVGIIIENANRAGRIIEVDRSYYSAKEATIALFTGEKVPVIGKLPEKSGIISIKGRFINQKTIQSETYHSHGLMRDYASIIGVLFSIIMWVVLLSRRLGKTGGSFG